MPSCHEAIPFFRHNQTYLKREVVIKKLVLTIDYQYFRVIF